MTLDRREIVKRARIDENRFKNQHFYIEGPRMFVAGAYVTITGGAGAMTTK